MSLNLKPGNIYIRNLKPKCQIDSDIHRKNSRIYSLWIYPITYAAFDAKYQVTDSEKKNLSTKTKRKISIVHIFQNIWEKKQYSPLIRLIVTEQITRGHEK